jgi:hypothetical protein
MVAVGDARRARGVTVTAAIVAATIVKPVFKELAKR